MSPKDAVAELAKVWQDALSVKAVYTQTRAVSFVDMPILSFEADADNGVISVTALGDNLSAEFFNGTQSASARLSISDGNNSVTSEYIPMVAKRLMPIVDVQFNEDGTATDKVKGYTITTEKNGNGGTLVVNNGIVTLGDSDDNMSYFKIDLAQGDGALKTSMNNGFTIEFVASSSNNQVGWAGAFGGEGFSLLRLEARYGSKWNISGWVEDGGWRYTDGTIAPAKDRYYHILYAYSAQTGQLDVYRDGVLDTKNANFNFVMRENSTVVIGARIDGGAKQSWNGNIASFAIYEKPTTAAYAEIRYAEVKTQVDALNGVTAQ